MNSRAIVYSIVIVATCSGFICKKDDAGPEPAKDCETNRTGTAVFRNNSTNSSYNVIFNNASLGIISPGQEVSRPVAAGVNHSVVFYFANASTVACNQAIVNVPQCNTNVYSCSSNL